MPFSIQVLGDSPLRWLFQAPRTEVLVLVGALYNPDLLQVPLTGPLSADVTDIDRAGVITPLGDVEVAQAPPQTG